MTRREIFGWAMFDFANSSYTTVVVTVVFAVYFTKVVAGGGGNADFLWSVGITISNIAVVALSPIIGAIADDSGRKKVFMFVTYAACVVGTGLLAVVRPGMIFWALLFFCVSNIAFSMGENLAGAFLPEISTPENIGKISGFGWGLGYLGGMGCLLLLSFTVLPKEMSADAAPQVGAAMLITAAFFLVTAIPTFALLRERAPIGPRRSVLRYAVVGFQRLWETTKSVRHFRELVVFLSVFFVFSSGLMTVIAFAAIYAEKTLGFTQGELVFLFLIVQISAAGGAVFFGWVQDKLGARRTIQLSLLIWIAVCVVAYFTETKPVFFGVVMFAGLGIGSLQSASRGMVGLFSPPSKAAEFFGLWGLAGKAAYAFGPAVFGVISSVSGSQRVAMLSTTGFFIVGLLGMFLVSEQRGHDAAAAWADAK